MKEEHEKYIKEMDEQHKKHMKEMDEQHKKCLLVVARFATDAALDLVHRIMFAFVISNKNAALKQENNELHENNVKLTKENDELNATNNANNEIINKANQRANESLENLDIKYEKSELLDSKMDKIKQVSEEIKKYIKIGKVLNNKLKQFVKKSGSKQELIEKILGHDPDYAITNLNNIERLADIYQQFMKDNYDEVASQHENSIETMKAITKMWKTSPKNPKNGLGFIQAKWHPIKTQEKLLQKENLLQKKRLHRSKRKPKKVVLRAAVRMPLAKKSKVSKKKPPPIKKKVSKNTACSLGFCGDEEKLNICEAKRPPGAQVIKEEYGAVTHEGRTFYFDTIFKRFFAVRLFQKDFGLFTQFKLHDISIYLDIWTYHHDDHTQTIEIPTVRGNTTLTSLISKMKIKSFILDFVMIMIWQRKRIQIY
ncbi:6900_t:CDS:2 [Cetraspora pellucida]|uniref:6900_t:CDS:1 n=1 Tax=Cetraspora pellucida TaxID=1433469 RepID=A0A9N8VPM4_9GLOM|nr:6900_t:CDS:2 [Cetraspora pellucida]